MVSFHERALTRLRKMGPLADSRRTLLQRAMSLMPPFRPPHDHCDEGRNHPPEASFSAGRPNRIVVLSGAGLSKASGIPTYRDAGGLWRDPKNLTYAHIDAYKAALLRHQCGRCGRQRPNLWILSDRLDRSNVALRGRACDRHQVASEG